MLDEILDNLSKGLISVDEAKRLLEERQSSKLPYATIDYERIKRCGVNETIYGQSKTADQIINIIQDMFAHKITRIMVTRVDHEKAAAVQGSLPEMEYNPVSRLLILNDGKAPEPYGTVCVVTAGTSDLPVAEEAAGVLAFLGHNVQVIHDVGVAGLHRLTNRIEEIRSADVVIVVAGMEGARASVIGGLVERPVVAVPTSVGYGASFEGLSALLSMLNSCASGIGVVNIDNGFGGAMLADSILRLCKEKANGAL